MYTKTKWFGVIAIVIAITIAFAFFTCENLSTGNESPRTVFDNAQEPVITEQPAGGRYNIGAQITVRATVDEGVLSYQWYMATDAEYEDGEGTELEGATSNAYTIDLSEGEHKVYVRVTNTDETAKGAKTAFVNSKLVRVIIDDPANADYPYITVDPFSEAYEFTSASVTVSALTVTASVDDGGTLSYQWYSSDTYSNEDGTEITNAVSASYTPPPITGKGIKYYYVVVTNTNNSASGRKTSVAVSAPAGIMTVNATITVNSEKAQYVRGFGVMAPFWSNAPQDEVANYETMYNPKGLGYNMLRIMIPVDETSTDMNVIMAKLVDVPNDLSGDKDRRHYYDIVKVVNKYGGYVLASPWSPPPSWKTNNSKNGGGAGAKAELKKEFYSEYADYLKEYARIMYNNGAPVYAVSIQNEPNFPADYDGCEWTGAQMRDFFRQVGRFTEGVKGWGGGKEIPVVLTMFGESANSPTDSLSGLNDPDATEFIDLYARHLYGSQQVTISSQVQAKGKEIWMTEHNVNGGNAESYTQDSTYNYLWKFLNDVDVTIRLNKENGFVWWYGKRFYSMVGEGDYGTVDGAVLPRGWALSHYAKYASNTYQVGLTISGTNNAGGALSPGNNINNTSFDIDRTAVRVTAFVSVDGNSLSLVMFTPTNTSGGGGTDMGDVRINFPDGFTATKVTGMRTKNGDMGKADNATVLLKGGTSAYINLPMGQILSVRFTK